MVRLITAIAATMLITLSMLINGYGDDNKGAASSPLTSSIITGAEGITTFVEGVDLSGRYTFDNYQCVDVNENFVGTADVEGLDSIVTIQGNSLNSIDRVGNCTITSNGWIIFKSDRTFTSNSTDTVPLGNCSTAANLFITTVEGTQEVLPLNLNFIDGQSEEFTGAYAQNTSTGILAITELLPPVSIAGVTCVAISRKV